MSGTTVAPQNTLLLDRTTWDLCVDANGNIAMASPPYSVAQDCASAVRTFLGEVYYDTTQGGAWFQDVLGHNPPLTLLKSMIATEAMRVPGCASVVVYISSVAARQVAGQLQVTDTNGKTATVAF